MKNNAWNLNGRAWKTLWKMNPNFFRATFLRSVLTAITPYTTIYFSAQIINELAGNRNPQILLKWVLVTLSVTAVIACVSGVVNRWSNVESSSLFSQKQKVYIDKMMHLDYADIDRQSTYDLYSQIQQGDNWAGWGLATACGLYKKILTVTIQILFGICLCVSLFTSHVPESSSLHYLNSPLFAAGIILIMLLIAVISPLCTNKGESYFDKHAEDVLLGNRFFSFYGFMAHERNRAADLRMYQQQEHVCNVYIARDKAFKPGSPLANEAKGPMGLWNGVGKAISAVLTFVVYLFVCLKAWGGAFGVGSVTQYIGVATQLFMGIVGILEVYGIMKVNARYLKQTYNYLDMPNKMHQGSLATEKRSDRHYELEFQDVSFQYPDTDLWVLHHVNLKFNVGSRLAVVGMNGSGKTTFIKLLCRLYDPTEGRILLNGIDIRDYRYEDYISIFSVVFQDFKLLAMPLSENVAGSKNYNVEKVIDCLKKAGFESRVTALPKGLDTYLYKDLDKEGVDVSGGESQKIAIARAIYKNAPFIILDEPTAALDPAAEAEIYEKFDEIAGNKTAVYISHRLSSCKFCDEIAVFHQGEIVQTGTHAELVADLSGKYYELWSTQARYYKNEGKVPLS